MTHYDRNELVRRRESLWYREPVRENVLNELQALANEPQRTRLRTPAILAESNAGKSALYKQFARRNPPQESPLRRPEICVDMSGVGTIQNFSAALLRALGAPDPERGTHVHRMERFFHLAEAVDLGLVFLDEFHDCVRTKGKGMQFVILVKHLLNSGVRVVPMGMPALMDVLTLDNQVSSRIGLRFPALPRVLEDTVVKALMHELAGPEANFPDSSVRYILKETRGVLGYVLDFTEETLVHHQNLLLDSLEKQRPYMWALDSLT